MWSRTWNFAVTNRVHVNNYGFVSDLDYDARNSSPLLAVIGDSYIEAARIPWEETGAARLQMRFADRGRVYAFGASGAPLSQYLAYATFAHQEFRADGLVILVVGNDFDESVRADHSMPGFHYFVKKDRGELALERMDYQVTFARNLLKKSSLGMYLITNLNLFAVGQHLRQRGHDEGFAGNTRAECDRQRLNDSQQVVDTFLTKLPDAVHLAAARIVIVLDGIRPQLYAAAELQAVQENYYAQMRQYLLQKALEQGFEVLDMEPIFSDHYARYGQRFEFPQDNHWNSLGHALFAEAVAQTHVVHALFHASK